MFLGYFLKFSTNLNISCQEYLQNVYSNDDACIKTCNITAWDILSVFSKLVTYTFRVLFFWLRPSSTSIFPLLLNGEKFNISPNKAWLAEIEDQPALAVAIVSSILNLPSYIVLFFCFSQKLKK